MIIKLASALNMSRSDLEEELKNSMSGSTATPIVVYHENLRIKDSIFPLCMATISFIRDFTLSCTHTVAEIPGEEDSEAELLLTKGVLKLFDTEV